MYPYLRMVKEMWKFRKAPKIDLFQTHISTHRIWPVDLDPWFELNNGRTLTLYDLGRIPMAQRMGLDQVLRQKRWGMTVAGNSTRYRKRVKLFERITMRSRLIGWDARFLYMEQSMWRGEDCTSHVLLRAALVKADGGRAGLVSPTDFAQACGIAAESPTLPDWVRAWAEADGARPWPPEM